MEEQGLAQQAAGGMPQGMSREEMMQLVQQVAELLKQGVSPEQLMQKGVPEEIIDMAMQMVGAPDVDTDAGNIPMAMQGEKGLAASAV